VVAAAAQLACGPPPVTPTPGAGDAGAADAPPFDAPVEPPAAEAGGEPEAAAEPASPAEEPFRAVLAALAGGSARAVRNFVPSGGRLLLRTDICHGPLGRVRCREHETDAERRTIGDEELAPWQGVLAEVAAADPGFSPAMQPVHCAEAAPPRWSCTTELRLGFTQCRGDYTATVDAVLLQDGAEWQLERLGLAQEILVCE
jgi:hypothetical protein